MAAGLLERVGIVGGNGGGDEPPTAELPVTPGLDPDPAPGEATRDRRAARKSAASAATSGKQPRAGGKFVSQTEQTKKVAAELETMLKLLAFTWSMSDEECAGVLNDTSARIAADLGSLVCRSEWLRDKITEAGLLTDIIKFLTGISPLLKTVWAHHLSPAARMEREGVTDDATAPVPAADPFQYGPWRPSLA